MTGMSNNNKDTATRVAIGNKQQKRDARWGAREGASSPSSSHKGHDMMKKVCRFQKLVAVSLCVEIQYLISTCLELVECRHRSAIQVGSELRKFFTAQQVVLVTTKSYLLQVFAPVLDRVATKFCVAVKGMLAEIRR